MSESTHHHDVAGTCPMGCGKTLFLGAGGHVTCSWIKCPDPARADKLLHAEVCPCCQQAK